MIEFQADHSTEFKALEMKPKRKRPCWSEVGQSIFSVSYSAVYHTVSRKQARLVINSVIVVIMG
jgi:hypothetical protein